MPDPTLPRPGVDNPTGRTVAAARVTGRFILQVLARLADHDPMAMYIRQAKQTTPVEPPPTTPPGRYPLPDAHTAALQELVVRVNGFVYAGERLNTVLDTVNVLRADPTLARRVLTAKKENP